MFIALYFGIINAFLVLPMLKETKYIYILALSLPFFVLYLVSYKRALKDFLIFIGVLLAVGLISFVYNYFMQFSAAMNLSFIMLLCFLPYFMFDYLRRKNNEWELKMVLTLTLLIFVFVAVRTFIEFSVNPLVSRMLASGDKTDDYLVAMRNSNVGGFGFSYAVGLFVPLFAARIMQNSGRKRFVYIIAYITVFYYCFLCQYTTLVTLNVIFTIVIFIRYKRGFLFNALTLVVGFLLIINFARILKFLSLHLPFDALSKHFESMYIALTTGEETTQRLDLMARCLHLFRRNLFFGADLTDTYNKHIINHSHSTYISLLASNGIFGAAAVLSVTVYLMKNFANAFRDKFVLIMCFIYYIVLGIVNPNTFFEITVVMFLMIPIMEYLRQEKEARLYEREDFMGA